MITIRELDKTYWTGKGVHALDHVSLDIPQGEIIGLFGENGAGKTTLIKSILGYVRAKGEILLDGAPIDQTNITRLAFATVEHSFFRELTAAEHRDFYRKQFPKFREKRFRGLVEFFDLPMNVPAGRMSHGQQNQLEVILALSQGADYIFMDEPFAGNDMFNREDFYRLILGILEPSETILLSTHLLEEVKGFVGRALLLHQGKLIGDRYVMDLEEEGMTLTAFVQTAFDHRLGRVAEAIAAMTDENEEVE